MGFKDDIKFRKDIQYMLDSDWEPKVPSSENVLKQAKMLIGKGKTTGNVALDIKAKKALKEENER